MGKKVKTGKFRKDKFYQLAKEAGYRSRAAFKLLQLNRKYHFLEKARVCVDLCAAPGGWLQVAAMNMPMSSVIIGVDLAPIKSIANVITHVEDITTDKCRSTLKKDLNDNKADIVLHDGAPNVGKNWLFDAYQQNMLVLQSFKLASEFLKKGGTFVTKVFRSKDYFSIMWVFQQFFKKVESTKPQASRNESAEIFVVCQHYKAPERIDPKFFDIKFVFSEVENTNDNKKIVDLFKNDMNQRHRGGYPDGDLTLYHRLNASDFVANENFIELLAGCNEIVLDDPRILNHAETDEEIKQCIKDIKLLGKNEIKNLLKWRLKIKAALKAQQKQKQQQAPTTEAAVKLQPPVLVHEDDLAKINEHVALTSDAAAEQNATAAADIEADEDEKLEEEIQNAVLLENKMDKKKRKKEQKEKRKLKEKIALKMTFQNDIVDHEFQGDNEIFSLNKIKTKQQLLALQGVLPGIELSDDEFGGGDEVSPMFKNRKRRETFAKDSENGRVNSEADSGDADADADADLDADDDDGFLNDDVDQFLSMSKRKDQERVDRLEAAAGPAQDYDEDDNPLLDDLVLSNTGAEKKSHRTNLWFSKDAFDFLKDSEQEQNNEILNEFGLNDLETDEKEKADDSDSSSDDGDSDEDNDSVTQPLTKKRKAAVEDTTSTEQRKKTKTASNNKDTALDSRYDDDDDEVQNSYKDNDAEIKAIKAKLSAEELAIGEMLVNSKKGRNQLIDDSFNRYSKFDDPLDLPSWFREDEDEHCKKVVPLPKETLIEYKRRFDEINSRPIKKVVEAEARKKKRLSKKLDRARKKAEGVSENTEMTDKERSSTIKSIYKRAGLINKKKVEVKYVVAQKGQRGAQTAKSKGVKGPYKVVDKRLKKDKYNTKKRAKAFKKKK